ncbi:hypothetical protein PBRA_004577 [Plasmodiophora brassicae]|nr:hypothetical protein PBRA_004577 [Plasmodiophora brassicae]
MYLSAHRVSRDLMEVAVAVDANQFMFGQDSEVWDAVAAAETELEFLSESLVNVTGDLTTRVAYLHIFKIISGAVAMLTAKATSQIIADVPFLDAIAMLLQCVILLDRTVSTHIPETLLVVRPYGLHFACLPKDHGKPVDRTVAPPTTTQRFLDGLTSINLIAFHLGSSLALFAYAEVTIFQAVESLLNTFRSKRRNAVARLHHMRNLPENRVPSIDVAAETRRRRVFRPLQYRSIKRSIAKRTARATRIRAQFRAVLSDLDSDIDWAIMRWGTFILIREVMSSSSSDSVLCIAIPSIESAI